MVSRSSGLRDDTGNACLYTTHPSKHIFTNFDEIVRFDQEFWEVTRDLPIRTGSLFRLRDDALGKWRIGVTDENRDRIKSKSERFRLKDIREMEDDSNVEILESTTSSDLMRNGMVRVIVHLATKMLKAMDDGKREFNICDLASGFGQTSVSLATSLYTDSRDILERTNFHLVDYSQEKLGRAQEKLKPYKPASVNLHPMNDGEFLRANTGEFDLVLALCHLHRKSFLADTLREIHDALSRKGVVISGDWHSAMSDHPLFVYQFLERAGVDNRRLKIFRDIFSAFMDPSANPLLSAEEMRGVVAHQDYWAGVYQEILASSSSMKTRHYVLGAFDTTAKRVELMEDAKLIVDPERIRKAFPTASLRDNPVRMANASDRASVMIALRGKPR